MLGYEVFHKELMTTLLKSVREGKNANTYIFEGVAGLGKHESARLFAKALVCDDVNNAPCCNCSACREAQATSHPDILFIKPEKDKATIGVEPVRDAINEALIKPFYNRHKVFIIDDGDILTPQAQNALLKMIEEPPQYAVFIIVCTNSEILLETVRSRAVTVTFSPLPDQVVREYIETKFPDEPRVEFLVKYCAGIPKSADLIVADSDFDTMREEVLNLVPRLLSKNKIHAYDVAEYVEKNKDRAGEIYDMILMYLRDAVIYSMGKSDNIINTDKSEKISILGSKYEPQLLARAIDEVMVAKKMLERHVKTSATALHAGLSIR